MNAGGSRVDIVGPTAAFIPIVVGVVHHYGAAGCVQSPSYRSTLF